MSDAKRFLSLLNTFRLYDKVEDTGGVRHRTGSCESSIILQVSYKFELLEGVPSTWHEGSRPVGDFIQGTLAPVAGKSWKDLWTPRNIFKDHPKAEDAAIRGSYRVLAHCGLVFHYYHDEPGAWSRIEVLVSNEQLATARMLIDRWVEPLLHPELIEATKAHFASLGGRLDWSLEGGPSRLVPTKLYMSMGSAFSAIASYLFDGAK